MNAGPPVFYRYRTLVLAGPWRSRPEDAIDDAVTARQARFEEGGRLVWLVQGSIEASGLVFPDATGES